MNSSIVQPGHDVGGAVRLTETADYSSGSLRACDAVSLGKSVEVRSKLYFSSASGRGRLGQRSDGLMGGAVVIGASMAGLLAARAVSDCAKQVTIIERDDLPEGPEPRKGVPQGRHAHALLASGGQVLEELFPGILSDLVARGAVTMVPEHGRMWQRGGYRLVPPGIDRPLMMTRPFLEDAVRQRVLGLPNVSLLKGTAKGLCVDHGRAEGLMAAIGDNERRLDAELVVDASGRGSPASRWLEQHGYPPPETAEIRIDVGYASRLFGRSGTFPEGSFFAAVGDASNGGRTAGAFQVEGERYLVSLGGYHGDYPPTDEDGFRAFAESLPSRDVAKLVAQEEPLSPIVAHKFPSNQWRHFEKVKRQPAGFIAFGDAIASFNPVYGQGMSVAALEARALAGCLTSPSLGSEGLPSAFYGRAAKLINNPWTIAAGADFQLPQTTGPKPPFIDLFNGYSERMLRAAQTDTTVATAFFNVGNLTASPASLMTPAMILRVLRASRRGADSR
jgi:2-polyprenyl-6-methoxyphenol hydroxylase-like FAD-dependent oxidoreductase